MLDLIKDLGLDKVTTKLLSDLKTLKIVNLPYTDSSGRGLIWLRLRNHNPSTSTPADMARCVAFVILRALSSNPDVQRHGICLINDMSSISLGNIQPSAAKFIFARVFPCLPVRVGRVYIVRPPFIVGNVILPIALRLMSSKLRSRVVQISDPKELEASLPERPDELDGSTRFDGAGWIASL